MLLYSRVAAQIDEMSKRARMSRSRRAISRLWIVLEAQWHYPGDRHIGTFRMEVIDPLAHLRPATVTTPHTRLPRFGAQSEIMPTEHDCSQTIDNITVATECD
jgi:hypothetical protein